MYTYADYSFDIDFKLISVGMNFTMCAMFTLAVYYT